MRFKMILSDSVTYLVDVSSKQVKLVCILCNDALVSFETLKAVWADVRIRIIAFGGKKSDNFVFICILTTLMMWNSIDFFSLVAKHLYICIGS